MQHADGYDAVSIVSFEGRRRYIVTTHKKAIAALALSAAMAAAPMAIGAQPLLNKILTGGAAIYGVKLISGPLNAFINQIMLANHVANQDKTKVVPILTVGSATYVGAAQVSGPESAVNRVQAVGTVEIDWNNGVWRGSALIPIDSLNPLKGFKRVYGVGVDAVINARL
jgi:hypothetical protein